MNWLVCFTNSDLFINLDCSLSVRSKVLSKFEIPEIGGPVRVESCNLVTNLGRFEFYVPPRGEFFAPTTYPKSLGSR